MTESEELAAYFDEWASVRENSPLNGVKNMQVFTTATQKLRRAAQLLRRSDPVVTDEMVERACNAFWGPLGLAPLTDQAKEQERRRMKLALEAALNVSQPGGK